MTDPRLIETLLAYSKAFPYPELGNLAAVFHTPFDTMEAALLTREDLICWAGHRYSSTVRDVLQWKRSSGLQDRPFVTVAAIAEDILEPVEIVKSALRQNYAELFADWAPTEFSPASQAPQPSAL